MHLSSILLFQVEEGVSPSKTSNVEEDNLDDLISAAMGDLPDEDTQPEENKRSTSTPTKDDGGVDNQDFGGFISMIRDDSEPPPPVQGKKVDDKPRDIPLDRRSGGKVNLRPQPRKPGSLYLRGLREGIKTLACEVAKTLVSRYRIGYS